MGWGVRGGEFFGGVTALWNQDVRWRDTTYFGFSFVFPVWGSAPEVGPRAKAAVPGASGFAFGFPFEVGSHFQSFLFFSKEELKFSFWGRLESENISGLSAAA